ncbi:M23 family metallopeptidase [Arthrobacter mobilis]|uniref:M23 family metallopeptidase n=1 Tax=Arthrobacter mobilis TaxID=2724944 RepID=A0A7X6HB81_9MICC|nr:M23 family metallopeptidase [Arthrobacter mobilis]NKX52953.1 M23 family metallopeptidase [Arthrobacter mobilis]
MNTASSGRGRRRAEGRPSSLLLPAQSAKQDGLPSLGRRRAAGQASPLTRLGRVAGLAAAAASMVAAAALPAATAQNQALPAAADRAAVTTPVDVGVPTGEKLMFKRSTVTSQAAPAAKKAAAAKKTSAAGARLAAPVKNMKTSSGFGYRVNPVTGAAGEFHNGLDFAHPCGTPVRAARPGKVTEASSTPYGYGNRIVVDHGNGVKTTYNHLQTISVRQGQQVSAGQKIAGLGTTGNSTGCHLHFEVMVKGKAVDPKGWL